MTSGGFSPWVSATTHTAPAVVRYDTVTGRPTKLEQINEAQGTKLGGIAPAADVTGDNTSRDTNAVAGAPATTVRDNASNAVNAVKKPDGTLYRVSDIVVDVDGLKATYGSTASAAENANKADVAKTAAEAARDIATQAKTTTETARNAAQAAQTAAEGYRDQTITARDVTTGARDVATAAQAGAQSARDAASTAETNARDKASEAAQSASNASGSASTASGQATIATQKADAAGQSASNASASAQTANTKAGEAGVSQYQAALSERNAAGSRNAAASSASVAASTLTKTIEVIGNENFDNGLIGWSETGSMFIRAYSAGRSNVAETTPGQFVVMRGRIVSIVSSRQRFRLSIGYRGVSGKGFTNYLGVFFFKDDGSQIYGSDGTGNYPLGAGFSVSPEVDNGWQDRNVYIGKGDVPGSAYGGTTVIPDGAVSFQPVAYLNYVALSDDAVAQVDYFRVEDATTEFYASKSATAAAQSSANAAASENNAGQAATAAQNSATNAATSAGNASVSASQASTSATSAEGSKNAAASSASLSAGSATDSANKAQAAANSAGAAKTSETNAGQSASSASTSANTANTKAGEASASATQAATSESNAAGSKNAASASANLAAGSATDAANKAQAAANSATAAKTSETNAGQSAVSATGSANTATTKAGEASSSATSAATSASNAEGSKNAAYASQTQAAASADTAQQKAGAAASSASSAATSADSAGQSAGAAQSSATNAATSAGSASTSASQASTSAANAEGSRIAAASNASVAATSADAASISAKATLPSNFADPKNWANYGGWGGSVTFENGKANLKNGGSFYSTFTMPVAAGETYRVTARHRAVNQGGGVTYIGLIELSQSGAPGSIVWQIGGRPTALVNEWEVSVFEFTGEYVLGQYGPIKSIGVVFLSGYPNVSDAEVSLLQMENVTSEKKAALSASAAATNASNAAISAGIAGQSASAAQGSATNAATSAGNASTSVSQASSSASSAQGAANSAASSAAVAASSYNKSIAAIGNDNFDSGADGWFDASQLVPVVSSYGRSNVIRSNAGAYIAPLHGRKIPITSVSQIFRLRISLRCAVAQSVYYVGAIYYDGNDAIVAATDGTGNYPLGASFTLDSTVHGWLDRETIIGKTVTGYTYGGNQNIPANAAYFRPCIYLNYSQIGNSVTEVDYYTVEDVTAFMQAANSASAAAGSASSAATSASNAGQSASAANTSKVQAEAANGAAQSAASNAQSSAATASSKASEASSFANLAASYSVSTEGNRRNLIKTEWWRAGATIPWDKNGGQEDRIHSLPDGLNDDGNWSNIKAPDGSAGDVWLSRANSVGHEGGGWNNGPIVPLDPDKTYRFVIPIAALGFQGGVSYWGTGNVCELNSTTPNPNPYFATYGNLPLDRWHLFVGYIFPRNSTGKSHDGAGVWDMVTGVKLGAGSNYCFTPGGYQPIHRAYQYYATSGRYQAFGRPLVECVDGSETPFALLLGAKLDSTNNAAAIREESSARATALSSMSARQSSVEAQVGGVASRVQSAEGAIAAIDGKTQAYFEKKASVPGADAFISAVAKNDNGVATSNVAIGGTSIALYNTENGSAKRAMFLAGGNAVFDGSITATTGIIVGTGKLKVQIAATDYAVVHDQYVSFGYDLGRAPSVTFGPCPVGLNTGEVYAPYAAELSSTGFRAKLLINAAPQSTAQSTGAFANQGGNIYQVPKGGRPNAANGQYTFVINLSAYAYAYSDNGDYR